MKVKVISLPNIFQVLYVLCFTRPRYQLSVYRNIGPLVTVGIKLHLALVFITDRLGNFRKLILNIVFELSSKYLQNIFYLS